MRINRGKLIKGIMEMGIGGQMRVNCRESWEGGGHMPVKRNV